jgi:hypothetical protein
MKASSIFPSQPVDRSPAAEGSRAAGGESDRRRERRLTLIILLVAGLARLPFLWHGFGGHPDEWLVIRSGLDFWLNGTYLPSRIPGYPLNELLMGGLAWLGGSTACAAAATVASLVTLAYMRALAPLHGIKDSFWMVLAFSFEPWIWSSGIHGMDYIWGTGSLVAALYYVEARRFGAAGLACAVGFGFRPSSLLWIIPVFLRVLLIDRGWRGAVSFALWATIAALIPLAMIVSVIFLRPETWTDLSTEAVSRFEYLFQILALAVYHLIETIGHIPALLIIIAGCFVYRDRFFRLFRSGESGFWTYVLIFVFLLPTFVIESGKMEYMLPALPGLFMILGRCITDNWWKAMTAAFVINAFVTVGFGQAPYARGVRIELAAPSLRPGALLWYLERATASNDRVGRADKELSEPSEIIRADADLDRLDDFYVSSLLERGPAAQARISCPLAPALLSFRTAELPQISRSNGLPHSPPSYHPKQILVCCKTMSGMVLSDIPLSETDRLKAAVPGFCESTTAPGGTRPVVR